MYDDLAQLYIEHNIRTNKLVQGLHSTNSLVDSMVC